MRDHGRRGAGRRVVVVLGEHFACDLGVAGFVGADEAELVASKERHEAVEQEECRDPDEEGELTEDISAGDLPAEGGERRGQAGGADRPGDVDGRGGVIRRGEVGL